MSLWVSYDPVPIAIGVGDLNDVYPDVRWPDMYIKLQNPSFKVSLWSTEFVIELRKFFTEQKVTLIVLVLH